MPRTITTMRVPLTGPGKGDGVSLRSGITGRLVPIAIVPLLLAAIFVVALQWHHEGREAGVRVGLLAGRVRAGVAGIFAAPRAALVQAAALVSGGRDGDGDVLAALAAVPAVDSVVLVSGDGRVVARAGACRPAPGVTDVSGAPWWRRAREGGGVVWSRVHRSRLSGMDVVTLATGAGGRVLAVEVAVSRLEDVVGAPDHDFPMAVIVLDRARQPVIEHLPGGAVHADLAAVLPETVFAGRAGGPFDLRAGGKNYVCASLPVAGPGWTVVAMENRADIQAHSRVIALLFGGSIAAALVLAVIMAVATSSMIANPLDELGRAVSAISRGSYELDIPAQPYRELETLAGGVRRMARTVRGREELLSESYERLNEQYILRETLLDAVPLPVFFISDAGEFMGCNRAFEDLCGRGRDEMDGLTPADLDGAGVPDFVAGLFSGGKRPGFGDVAARIVGEARECRVRTASGGVRIMLWQARAFGGPNDRHRGFVCVLADISDLREAEIKLRQAQKMEAIGTLAGGIAHDFNNILNAVLGYAELSLLEVEAGSEVAENLSQITAAGRRAAELVRQILTFSRRREGAASPILLGPVVKESVKLLKATVPPDIELVCRADPDAPPVMGDVSRCQQMVMNLCTNAVQAMEDGGGRLEVTLEVAGGAVPRENRHGWLVLRVADTGPGIPESIRERIFEPYFSTKDRGPGGTGLGLAIVHGIVSDMDGVIEVDDNPGGGAVFTVWLPVCEGRAAEAGPERVVPVMAKYSGRVMVVDDEEMLRNFVGRALEMHGCEVESFATAVEALERFEAEPHAFDLVMTDQVMPGGMSGTDLARRIKERRPGLPVVLFTGYGDRVADGGDRGIDDCRIKPLAIADISDILGRFLAG